MPEMRHELSDTQTYSADNTTISFRLKFCELDLDISIALLRTIAHAEAMHKVIGDESESKLRYKVSMTLSIV